MPTRRNRDRLLVQPTAYRGVTMRSKTEARAAAWFESFGWRWIYEPEAFACLGGTPYTPDFYLPDIETLVEVKPVVFLAEFDDRRRRLVERTGKQFALIQNDSGAAFSVADFYGYLEPCDPWNDGDPEPWGWHSEAPESDARTVYIDDGDKRFPRTFIYMGAGCKLRHRFGRNCPCTN